MCSVCWVTACSAAVAAVLTAVIGCRFRTSHPNGVLLYSQGAQGDILAIQLVENKLRLDIDLGTSVPAPLRRCL